MNERIQELKRQASMWCDQNIPGEFDEDTGGYGYHWEEKFAELIVRECVQTLRDNTPVVDEHDSVEDWDRGYIRAMSDCEHHIQEHFGVEE